MWSLGLQIVRFLFLSQVIAQKYRALWRFYRVHEWNKWLALLWRILEDESSCVVFGQCRAHRTGSVLQRHMDVGGFRSEMTVYKVPVRVIQLPHTLGQWSYSGGKPPL